MRNLPFLLIPLVFSVPLLAQGLAPSPIQPVGDKTSLQHNSGLQAALDGQSLVGGGTDYRATFSTQGLRFEPALGSAVHDTQYLTLAPISVRRGAATVAELPSQVPVAQYERTAVYAHSPVVRERYDVRPEGVELSWVFEQPLAGDGDLVVRYAVDTSLPAPVVSDGGLAFTLPEIGGVKIGGVTGIDARGQKVAGAVRYVGGALELSLPAAFVATAAYPLVLDPVVGAIVNVTAGLGYDETEPDVAYDATTNSFLVVWLRTFSASSTAVRGQRVSNAGALLGTTIFFNANGVASRGRVANLSSRDRFGVVWTQVVGTTSSVEFEAVAAGSGMITSSFTVASSTAGDYLHADIGCETDATIGTARGFVISYEDNVLDAIRARRLWFNAADTLVTGSAFSVYTDVLLGNVYTQPAISRTAAADGKLLLVARRSIFLGASSIVATVLSSNSSTTGATVTVFSNSSYNVTVPDVDGYAGKWVVAWQRDPSGSSAAAAATAPVSLDATGTALSVGSVTTFGGTTFAHDSSPTVGYTAGRAWLGFRVDSILVGGDNLAVVSLDSASCASCNESFSNPIGATDSRIVVATMTSGGLTSGEDGLAVWGSALDIFAQRVRNHTNGGGIANLGGGCGSGGTQSFSHNPAIGSSGLVCALNGLSANALATIFNFSEPTTTIPCGACVWTPFSVTLTPPVVAGSARVEFPIPCLTSLVGSLFETQWTTVDFSQAPCSIFPGFALSPRALLTIGN